MAGVVDGRVRLGVPVLPIVVVLAGLELLGGLLRRADLGPGPGFGGEAEIRPDPALELLVGAVVADFLVVGVHQVAGAHGDVDIALGVDVIQPQIAAQLAHGHAAHRIDGDRPRIGPGGPAGGPDEVHRPALAVADTARLGAQRHIDGADVRTAGGRRMDGAGSGIDEVPVGGIDMDDPGIAEALLQIDAAAGGHGGDAGARLLCIAAAVRDPGLQRRHRRVADALPRREVDGAPAHIGRLTQAGPGGGDGAGAGEGRDPLGIDDGPAEDEIARARVHRDGAGVRAHEDDVDGPRGADAMGVLGGVAVGLLELDRDRLLAVPGGRGLGGLHLGRAHGGVDLLEAVEIGRGGGVVQVEVVGVVQQLGLG